MVEFLSSEYALVLHPQLIYLIHQLLTPLLDQSSRILSQKGTVTPSVKGFPKKMNLQMQTVKQTVTNEVPHLRLVYAAVAIPGVLSDRTGAAYLLEERIRGKFIKYINNNSATPAHHLQAKEEKIGLFLCFAQHVQYHLTNEVVYLSDF
jgi:hypothetical protein